MQAEEHQQSGSSEDALSVARAYHAAWSAHEFERATALLSEGLRVEVPINEYPTKLAFATALRGFGAMVEKIDLLAAMEDRDQAMLLYDMYVHGLGRMRIAEHFTVADGQITRLRQIHDTVPIRAAGLGAPASEGFARTVPIAATPELAFASLTTLAGLAGWWTPSVSGSAQPGGELEFRFRGVDESIRMRVETVRPNQIVTWTCLEHTGDTSWTGSQVEFELTENGHGCILKVSHRGVAAEQVEAGWEHFLGSIAAYLETGAGHPFGSS